MPSGVVTDPLAQALPRIHRVFRFELTVGLRVAGALHVLLRVLMVAFASLVVLIQPGRPRIWAIVPLWVTAVYAVGVGVTFIVAGSPNMDERVALVSACARCAPFRRVAAGLTPIRNVRMRLCCSDSPCGLYSVRRWHGTTGGGHRLGHIAPM